MAIQKRPILFLIALSSILAQDLFAQTLEIEGGQQVPYGWVITKTRRVGNTQTKQLITRIDQLPNESELEIFTSPYQTIPKGWVIIRYRRSKDVFGNDIAKPTIKRIDGYESGKEIEVVQTLNLPNGWLTINARNITGVFGAPTTIRKIKNTNGLPVGTELEIRTSPYELLPNGWIIISNRSIKINQVNVFIARIRRVS